MMMIIRMLIHDKVKLQEIERQRCSFIFKKNIVKESCLSLRVCFDKRREKLFKTLFDVFTLTYCPISTTSVSDDDLDERK